MSATMRIFDRRGRERAEVRADILAIAWRLNNVGKGTAFLPYTDPKCTQANLRYGNRILVQFDNGLPDFAGVIDTPRRRSAGGITFSIYTGERMLDFRRSGKDASYSGAPGAIFQAIIEAENTKSQLMTVGNIASSGTERSIEHHYHDILRRVRDLARLTGQDFRITSGVVAGSIVFYANWYTTLGTDKTNSVWLIGGVNCTGTLDEQGQIANQVYCVGEGDNWGALRLVGEANEATSRSDYDLREYAELQSAVVQGTLDANAETLVNAMAQPRKKFTLTAIDRVPARFSSYDIGDRVTLELFQKWPEWAFSGTVRIIAREWTANNTCRLEVEEYD
jgi:hypothetical protein